MKGVSFQRKPHYASEIPVTPSSTQNKTCAKSTGSKRGNSVTKFREKNLKIQDNEPMSLSSLITQSPKESVYSPCVLEGYSNLNQSCGENGTNSPKPGLARLGYSLSPSRVNNIEKIILPKSKSNSNKKTLVLDLDETLVHSGFKPFNIPSDIILKVELDSKVHQIHVLVRPGVEEFLQRMAKHYEIVIFTASLSKYADPLIDKLDHTKVCSFRLFREHCTMFKNALVKDLKRLDRDLKDLLIVDNNPVSYALNVENGFPIKTWYEDKKDRELYNISLILEFLAYVPDVREYIKKMVEKNDFSYSKAMSVINSHIIALKESQMKSLTSIIGSNSQNTCLPFSNGPPSKSLKETYFHYQKENEKEHGQAYGSNLTANPTVNSMQEANICIQSSKEKKGETVDDKQINIKIINNNFTQYIINSQDSGSYPQKSHKQMKGINTFRSSAIQNLSPNGGGMTSLYNSEPGLREVNVNKISNKEINQIYASSPNSPGSQAQSGNLTINAFNRNNINNGMHNIKSLNFNLTGNEVASPVLKNLQQYVSQNYSFNSNIATKYSSLIEQEKENTLSGLNPTKPSFAVIIKGRHNRELSGNLAPSNLTMNFMSESQLYRSPSIQNLENTLNHNYSKPNKTNIRRDISSQNCLSNINNNQIIKELTSNINAGHNTVRPSTSFEKLRININGNINPQIKQVRSPNVRSAMEEIILKRGSSQSSRKNNNT